jgi:hypothetical protein
MPALNLQRGDRVRIKNENLEGVVVEEKTRTVTVRVVEHSGKTRDRQIPIEDVERLPTTKERVLETPSARPIPVMAFTAAPNRWYGIDDAHVRDDRADGWFTALRTMYHGLSGNGIEQSVGLLGFHHRRVLTISALTGHEIFHKMQNAWDDHKMFLERHDIPEKRTLDIMRVTYVSGAARLAEEPTYAFAFVSVNASPAEMPRFTASAKALFTGPRAPQGLEGGALFANDEDGHEMLFTRWSGREPAQAFVNDVRNHVVLPPTEQFGDEAEAFDVKRQLVP